MLASWVSLGTRKVKTWSPAPCSAVAGSGVTWADTPETRNPLAATPAIIATSNFTLTDMTPSRNQTLVLYQ